MYTNIMQQRLVIGRKFVKYKIEKNVESKRYCTYKRACVFICQIVKFGREFIHNMTENDVHRIVFAVITY